jgi:hypothetical protein
MQRHLAPQRVKQAVLPRIRVPVGGPIFIAARVASVPRGGGFSLGLYSD